jgi:signal transduction histidine kinase
MKSVPADPIKIRHDFKNQLAIIRGFSEILIAEAAATDPRRRDLEEIHKAAVTALQLLTDVFAEPEADDSDHPDR